MPSLPRIASFHGSGSTASIYKLQCAQLAHLLKDDFEFVFFDAPFECSAGPGVLPIFASHAPFKSWFTQDERVERADGSGFDDAGTDGIERGWRMMEEKGAGGEWVGVIGFSQGTRMAGGLLLDQQRRDRGVPTKTGIRLKFGVLCMGGGAPMESVCEKTDTDDLISLPTLHVHGLKDPFLMLGRQQLQTHYDPATAILYQVDYHHAMPWVREEVMQLAEHIRAIYKDASDRCT